VLLSVVDEIIEILASGRLCALSELRTSRCIWNGTLIQVDSTEPSIFHAVYSFPGFDSVPKYVQTFCELLDPDVVDDSVEENP